MRPSVLVLWSVASLGVVIAAHSLIPLLVFLVASVAYTVIRLWTVRPAKTVVVLSLPFLVPLLLIHTFVNHAFSPTFYYHGIPVRLEGLQYGALVAARIAVMTALAALWRETDPEQVLHSTIRWRLPTALVVMTAMATAFVASIGRRVAVVLEAQQARGVQVHGNLLVRSRALIPIAVPVVVGSIVESEARAAVLHNRGLGSGPIAFPRATPFTALDMLDLAVCIGVCMSILMLLR